MKIAAELDDSPESWLIRRRQQIQIGPDGPGGKSKGQDDVQEADELSSGYVHECRYAGWQGLLAADADVASD